MTSEYKIQPYTMMIMTAIMMMMMMMMTNITDDINATKTTSIGASLDGVS